MLQQFVEKYTGQIVNFDGDPQNAGQSIQLIAQWCDYIGLPYQWAPPANWWDYPEDWFLDHWHRVERPKDAEDFPRPGDIIIFSSQMPGSDGWGHASIFVENGLNGEWFGFDANWGGMSAHMQSHNWAYVLGWFTPVHPEVVAGATPTPLALPYVSEPYDVEPIEARIEVVRSENAPLRNLQDMGWGSFRATIIRNAYRGDEITVSAVARHRLGGTYYMPDSDRPEGYDINDFESAPDPQLKPAAPAVPPPLPRYNFHNMAPPVVAANKDDTVHIHHDIPIYGTMSNALDAKLSLGYAPHRKYFVYKRLPNGTMNITEHLAVYGVWIRQEDLEPPKEPAWHVLTRFQHPIWYRATEDTHVVDIDRKGRSLPIKFNQRVQMAGYFFGPDGTKYFAPCLTIDQEPAEWYGLQEQFVSPFEPDDVVGTPAVPAPVVVAPALSFRDKLRGIQLVVLDKIKELAKEIT